MKLTHTIVALAAIAVMSTAAMAQQGGPGGPGGQRGPGGRGGMQSGPMFVIRMNTVQQELRLSAQQIEQINNMRPGGPGGPGGRGQGGPGQGGPGQGQGGQGQGGQGGPGGPPPNPLADILNEGQMNRLNQIALQWDAPMAWLDPRHSERLQISENQRQAITEIIRANGLPMGGPGGPGGPGAPMDWNEMLGKRRAAQQQALQILNQQQRALWGEMTGQAFNKWVQPPMPQRPGGGQGGGRGGN